MHEGPDFERLRQALLLQGEPDRVPLAEVAVDEDVKRAFLGGRKEGVGGEIEFWRKAGYDYLPIPQGLRTMIKGRSLSAFVEALPEQARAVVRSVRQVHKARYGLYSEESERQWAHEGTGIISGMDQFDAFPWPEPEQFDYSPLDQAQTLMPDGMGIIAAVGDIISLIYLLMGQEYFCLSVYDNPELVQKMYSTVGRIQYESVRRVVHHQAVKAVWVLDDIAYTQSLLVSPDHLRRYLFPWYKEMGNLCKRLDKPFLFHSDGRLYEVMDDLIECGFNAIHPIEPKAMDIALVKEKWGKRLCLIGNIDLGYTLTLGSPKAVEEEVKQHLREIARGGGYCLGSSNSIAEFVPLENFNAMRAAALKYGAYPIRL